MEKKLKEDFVKFLLDEYVYELFINSTDTYKRLAVEVIRHDAMERYDIKLSDDEVKEIKTFIDNKIMYYYEK
jgi:hypothetical protein